MAPRTFVTERGDDGVATIKRLTANVGADSVLECVGTNESIFQAINAARPGGSIGFVGVPHGVELKGEFLFFSQKNLLGGPAPVRRFLPHLIDLVLTGQINPGLPRHGRAAGDQDPAAGVSFVSRVETHHTLGTATAGASFKRPTYIARGSQSERDPSRA